MRNLILVVFAVLLVGADCERQRIATMDHGLMMTNTGLELHPMQNPWIVVARTLEQPDAFYDAIDRMNMWFEPYVVFEDSIDDTTYNALEYGPVEERYGVILVSEGHVGTPGWGEEFDFDDVGGIADLRWDNDGAIVYVDVVLNSDYTYDADWVETALIHELGHSLGLDHDENSIDLNSCMTSQPVTGCRITEDDVERVSNWLDI